MVIIIIMATTNTHVTIIKSFHFMRTLFQTTGIYSPQQNKNRSMNKKVLLILLCFVQFLIASCAYFLFKAKSIGDLAYSYLISFTLMVCLVYMIINTLKIPKTLQLIDKFDEFIRKSKTVSFLYFICKILTIECTYYW